MDQLIDFTDPFKVASGEKGQPLFGDVSKANLGAACDIEGVENDISTKSMDEKLLDQLMEEMIATENGEPPSSVLRALDRSSRSAEDFDPKLQHSPVSDNSTGKYSTQKEETLDYEVDWDPVRHFSRQIRGSSSQGPSGTTHRKSLAAQNTTPSTFQPSGTKSSPGTLGRLTLRPFKTFFHFGEMLETKMTMFCNSPDAVFELFARVIYSARENFGHRQYFQFRDLFKETPPFLSGALAG
ncbi:hypothetical protein ACRE_080540 [Hapsidospora chrysogenum ATCC 11550]|uniref:Uncharacterized protein n=1 Tax=Hapsidospora chrysogenum (strain ATCC 11550 / CBS 779.69 / DSM 880 / IAM 14645 / JCM 23072 / IMI 49137) TaxID=857340 RepID=A0A086SVV2_HAPC1|nr:hypothetical protein ACRE_080540 [Hapsidospora chrysogenum ATCC 11550]